MTAFYPIINKTTVPSDGYFEIPGNFLSMFTPGFEFVAVVNTSGSPIVSYPYTYTVSTSSFSSGATKIYPVLVGGSPPPSLTPSIGAGSPFDGSWVTLVGGAYSLDFSDPSVSSILIPVAEVNQDTSLVFPGRASLNYGEYILENFLHLLENFANGSPPVNPILGQLWYDKTNTELKLYTEGSPIWTPILSEGVLDTLYLRLDGSNDPVTGDVTFNSEITFDSGLLINDFTPGSPTLNKLYSVSGDLYWNDFKVSPGSAYDEIILDGSPPSSVINTTNVKTIAKTGTTSYQQVFRNGVLQREGSTGSYTVTDVNQITFSGSPIYLNNGDEILIYQL